MIVDDSGFGVNVRLYEASEFLDPACYIHEILLFYCGMCWGVIGIGQGLTFHEINSNDEKVIIKDNVINFWRVMFENDLKVYFFFIDIVSRFHCSEWCLVMKMVISSLFL